MTDSSKRSPRGSRTGRHRAALPPRFMTRRTLSTLVRGAGRGRSGRSLRLGSNGCDDRGRRPPVMGIEAGRRSSLNALLRRENPAPKVHAGLSLICAGIRIARSSPNSALQPSHRTDQHPLPRSRRQWPPALSRKRVLEQIEHRRPGHGAEAAFRIMPSCGSDQIAPSRSAAAASDSVPGASHWQSGSGLPRRRSSHTATYDVAVASWMETSSVI